MCTTKAEIEQIVRDQLGTIRVEMKDDMYIVANTVAKDILKHDRPSAETLKEIGEIRSWIHSHEDVSASFARALFGDKTTGDLGLVAMMRDVHEKMLSFNGVKGLFQWILLTGGVGAVIWSLFAKFPR